MEEILTVTQMPRDNFVAAMKMLCNPKIGVLKKNPNNPKFEKNHTMALNMAFKSNQIRLNVMPPKTTKRAAAGKTADEEAQDKIIEKERTFVVQAHIVKVMKAQKTYAFLERGYRRHA